MSNANVTFGKKSRGAGCLRWVGRIALGGLALILALITTGAIYQAVASARDEKIYKPVDQMVDVNGIQMRLDCRGSGSPTVVLEAGAQSSGSIWMRVQKDVAQFTRVCSYDRAGYGWSDSLPEVMPPQRVAELLHTLLENGDEQPPYLMVGHSLGGIFVRAFTQEYPGEVVGMVLVDSSHERQAEQIPPVLAEMANPKVVKTGLQIQWVLASIGVLRTFKLMDATNVPILLTDEERGPTLAEMYRTGYFRTIEREVDVIFAMSAMPGKLNSLEDMPLIVVSAENNGQEMYEFYESAPQIQAQLSVKMMQEYADFLNGLQGELAALSTYSKHVIVKDSGHFIQLEKPQVVIDAIREVFEMATR